MPFLLLRHQEKFYRTNPIAFIAYLLRDMGTGSVSDKLKNLDWADGIDVGYSYTNKFNTMIQVSIQPTEAGLDNWTGIGNVLFSYIKMVQNLKPDEKQNISEEVQKIKYTYWNTKEESIADSYCTNISRIMMKYPPSDWLSVGHIILQCEIGIIDKALECINPNNCFVQLISSAFNKGWYTGDLKLTNPPSVFHLQCLPPYRYDSYFLTMPSRYTQFF